MITITNVSSTAYSFMDDDVSTTSSESPVVAALSKAFCFSLSCHFFTQATSLLKYRGHSCIPKHGPYRHSHGPTSSCNRDVP